MSATEPAPIPSDRTVTTAIGPTGRFSILVGRPDDQAGNYAWEGISTGGFRSLSYMGGTFVLDLGQSFEDGLRACADRIGDTAAHKNPDGRAFLSSMADWTGKAAAYRNHFAAICGPCTLPIAAEGGSPEELAAHDRIYGRERVEAVLGRMPILLGPLRARLVVRASDEVLLACDAIMGETLLGLDELVGHVATLIADWYARMLFRPMSARPYLGTREALLPPLRRFLRAMEGQAADPPAAIEAMILCTVAPRGWMPRNARQMMAMKLVLGVLYDLCYELPQKGAAPDWERLASGLLAHVRGDWEGTARGLLRHAPGIADSGGVWVCEVHDMAAAFERQVVQPALAYACALTRTPVDRYAVRPATNATTLLFGGKGLVAIAEANKEWHARAAAMNEVVEGLSGFRSKRFPRPFPDFTASDGHRAVPILSSAELVAEGSAMGHCIGSYAKGCANGSYAVVSIRSPGGDRVSTVQIKGGTRVIEHKGHANGDPSNHAVLAVRELVERNAALPRKARSFPPSEMLLSLVRHVRAAAAPGWVRNHPYDPTDPVRILRAASLWDRFAPRDMRGSVEAIVSRVDPVLGQELARRQAGAIAAPAWRIPIGVATVIAETTRRVTPGPVVALLIILGGGMFYTGFLFVTETQRMSHREAKLLERLEASRRQTVEAANAELRRIEARWQEAASATEGQGQGTGQASPETETNR